MSNNLTSNINVLWFLSNRTFIIYILYIIYIL